MSNVVLTVKDLSLKYKVRNGLFKTFTHIALDNVSFQLCAGDVLGIIGGNGSGKSTLLKVLAGVFLPDDGKISVDKKLKCSLLTLGLGFNDDLTGRDNTIISCMLSGLNKKQAENLVEHIKIFSDLGEFFEQPVRTYSTGMRSRLGFSSAIYLDSDLLLIDETLSVGDRHFHIKAERAIKNKLKTSTSVIIVSHDLGQIKELCNRCMWLEKGGVISYGCTEEVLDLYYKANS